MTVIHPGTNLEYWSREYWLGHCQGFRVDDENGRVGAVEAILGGNDEPEQLLVRGGLFVRRSIMIPLDAVQEIEPLARRIRVATGGRRRL
jgi:hypothetical protein